MNSMKPIRDLAESLVSDVTPALDSDRAEFLEDTLFAGEFEEAARYSVGFAKDLGFSVDGSLIDDFTERFGADVSKGVKIKNAAA